MRYISLDLSYTKDKRNNEQTYKKKNQLQYGYPY